MLTVKKQAVARVLLAKNCLAACLYRQFYTARMDVTFSPFFLVAIKPPHLVAATHPAADPHQRIRAIEMLDLAFPSF
eukprot:COSAG02_NODE_4158_length_5692_cov_2.326541_7_plen_77_part_00